MQVSTQPEIADDPCKDVKYKEAAVDSMRAQKDEVHNLTSLLILNYYGSSQRAIVSCRLVLVTMYKCTIS